MSTDEQMGRWMQDLTLRLAAIEDFLRPEGFIPDAEAGPLLTEYLPYLGDISPWAESVGTEVAQVCRALSRVQHTFAFRADEEPVVRYCLYRTGGALAATLDRFGPERVTVLAENDSLHAVCVEIGVLAYDAASDQLNGYDMHGVEALIAEMVETEAPWSGWDDGEHTCVETCDPTCDRTGDAGPYWTSAAQRAQTEPAFQELVDKASEMLNEGRTADVKAALAKFNVARVSDVKPGDIPALMAALDDGQDGATVVELPVGQN